MIGVWLIALGLGLLQPAPRSQSTRQEAAFRQFGYKGPAALGPFRIDGKRGATPLVRLLARIGKPARESGDYLCYRQGTDAYLVLGRGADDRELIRDVLLSRDRNCFKRIAVATSFANWHTDRGIGLGSTEESVLRAYGKPTKTAKSPEGKPFYPGTDNSMAKLGGVAYDYVLQYRALKSSPDLSACDFGIANGRVVWIWLSDNE